MRVLVAPDKFKGSLTTFEACEAIKEGLLQADEKIVTLLFPMADGGDGFSSVIKYYQNTETISCSSVDPVGRSMSSTYEWQDDTAIIELASCSGLVLLEKELRDPLLTSTFGTGLQIRDAIKRGAKKIILGLGGSATNDAGNGILAALGFKFFDKNYAPVQARGGNLRAIAKVVPPEELPQIVFELACDVSNPLYGPDGAAHVYASQKGAASEGIRLLDEGLQHFAKLLEQASGKEIHNVEGTGAAGGVPSGLMAYFNVQFLEGARFVMEASDIQQHMRSADLVITGEGKLDSQSAKGKVVGLITSLAKEFHKPVVAICGQSDLTDEEVKTLGLDDVFKLREENESEKQSIEHAKSRLKEKIKTLIPRFREMVGRNRI
jgi:glycerate 2-kinase